uniref:Uncharacterized protein n=1 Tax=Timema bartmani TaxID=61472 RepID=A0A7R9F4J7_9NEOP|nr:unnamed protein product [Timema bartmani]
MGGCGIFSIYFVASLILTVVCPGVSPETPDKPPSQNESELMEPPRDSPNVISRAFSDNRSVKNRNSNSKRSSGHGSKREEKRSTKTKLKQHLKNKPVLTTEKSKTKSKSQNLDSGVSDLGNHLLKSLDSLFKSSNFSHFNNQSAVTASSAGKFLNYSDSGVKYQNSSHFINSYLNNSDLLKKYVNSSKFINRSTHMNSTGTMKGYLKFNDSIKRYVNSTDSKKSYVNSNDLNEKYKSSSDSKEAQKIPPPLAIIKADVMSFPKIPVGSRPTRKQMYVIPASQTFLNEPETPQEQSQLYSLQGSSHVSGQGYVLSRPSDTAHLSKRSKIASSERLQGFIVQHPNSYAKTSQHASPLTQQNDNSNRRLFPVGSLSQSALYPTSLDFFKNRQSGSLSSSKTSSQLVLMNQPSSRMDFLKRSRSGPSTSSRTSSTIGLDEPAFFSHGFPQEKSIWSFNVIQNLVTVGPDEPTFCYCGFIQKQTIWSFNIVQDLVTIGPDKPESSSQSVPMNQHSNNVDFSKSRQSGPSSYVGRGMDRKDLGSRSLEPVPPSQDMNFGPSLGHQLSGESGQDWNSRDYRDDVPPYFMSPILKRLGLMSPSHNTVTSLLPPVTCPRNIVPPTSWYDPVSAPVRVAASKMKGGKVHRETCENTQNALNLCYVVQGRVGEEGTTPGQAREITPPLVPTVWYLNLSERNFLGMFERQYLVSSACNTLSSQGIQYPQLVTHSALRRHSVQYPQLITHSADTVSSILSL